LNVLFVSRVQESYICYLDIIKWVSQYSRYVLFRCVNSDAHQDILLHIKLLNIHYHLLIVKFFVSKIDLALFNLKSELLLYPHLFNILNFSILRYKERIKTPISGRFLMRRLFLINLRVKRVYKEYAYEDILRIESLSLLLLLELLFLVLNFIQCQVALLAA